jgi:SAM-dependent methyltransferase
VVGIDASPAMIHLAAAHEASQPALVADAARLPFSDEAFDLVVAYMTLHDIDDMAAAVAEVGRVLERGGRLCASIVHPLNSAGSFQGSGPDAPFVISGSYLDPARLSYVVDRGGIQMTFHSEHRPLAAYGRALEAAGLLIEAIREPLPGDGILPGHPAERRWTRIPLFLHVRAAKHFRAAKRDG